MQNRANAYACDFLVVFWGFGTSYNYSSDFTEEKKTKYYAQTARFFAWAFCSTFCAEIKLKKLIIQGRKNAKTVP